MQQGPAVEVGIGQVGLFSVEGYSKWVICLSGRALNYGTVVVLG